MKYCFYIDGGHNYVHVVAMYHCIYDIPLVHRVDSFFIRTDKSTHLRGGEPNEILSHVTGFLYYLYKMRKNLCKFNKSFTNI